MFCRKCGHELNDNAIICPNCGVPTRNAGGQSQYGHSQYNQQSPTKGVQPEYVPVNNPVPTQAPVPVPVKRTNGFGIAGFVLSLLSVYFGLYMCIVPILSFVFSLIGVIKSKDYSSCNGLAIAGLVISIITMIFWFFVWVIVVLILGGTLY